MRKRKRKTKREESLTRWGSENPAEATLFPANGPLPEKCQTNLADGHHSGSSAATRAFCEGSGGVAQQPPQSPPQSITSSSAYRTHWPTQMACGARVVAPQPRASACKSNGCCCEGDEERRPPSGPLGCCRDDRLLGRSPHILARMTGSLAVPHIYWSE